MSRANQWFVPGEGIAREVITADIQRYLGPDALVRPGQGTGDQTGINGYWITAYRTLTSQMILDLRQDSQRWASERGRAEAGRGGSPYLRDTKVSRHPDSSLVAYQDSNTHAARQHWGPSETMAAPAREREREPARSTQAYSTSNYYTTGNTPSYGAAAYPGQQAAYAEPRTDPYAGYSHQPRDHSSSYPATHSYPSYSQPTPQVDYSARPPPPTQQRYPQTRYFGYFDEQFLVYR
ncbi:hypothetical protein K491DRAFT_708522 [Lophiostoma macrostomum CBS 122681]|uniref:Transcription factor RfeG n=1 Tax=Lophiostoma macrostomum CBS 122681 TaxID=1314788 RepID=A0A6A6SME6_9PLEO|nr:hypothetical protein K491DRAFT_708522 [Lophiostoma macrostomum CBS 122681]